MADQGEEDVFNEFSLMECPDCHGEFPVISFEQHSVCCTVFKELVNQGASQDLVDDAFLLMSNSPDSSDEDAACELVLCKNCDEHFPRMSINQHRVICELRNPKEKGDKEPPVADNPKNDEKGIKLENFTIDEPQVGIPFIYKSKEIDSLEEKVNENRDAECASELPKNLIQPKPCYGSSTSLTEEKVNENRDAECASELPKVSKASLDDRTEKAKRISDESKTFKIPYNPLLGCIDLNDNEELNKISDDEDSETLEEFWKRAQDFINNSRKKRLNV